jgi:hypothetical protein
MIKYPKIHSVYKRDENGRFNGEFSQVEFDYLFNNEWEGREKIDGTNIRIHWDGDEFQIAGRTDKAQIPEHLFNRISEICSEDLFHDVFGYHDEDEDPLDITLFGEGFGNRIQKVGSLYLNDEVDFILFDVKVGLWWLKRSDVIHIAQQLGIRVVPTIAMGTLKELIDYVKWGFPSKVAYNELQAEGLVLTPKIDLLSRNGQRIITKIKTKDFQ